MAARKCAFQRKNFESVTHELTANKHPIEKMAFRSSDQQRMRLDWTATGWPIKKKTSLIFNQSR